MNLKKLLIGAGIGGGLIAGITYLFRLKRTSVELDSFTSIYVHKIDLKGLAIRIDVQLKNPTGTKLKIKFPYVKLTYKDTVIGSSQVVDRDIEIPAHGEAVAEKIMVQVPVRSIFSVVAGLLASLQSGEQVKLTAKTITTIDLGWRKIPYEKTEELILKK